MRDESVPTHATDSEPRATLEELFAAHDRDPRGTREELRRRLTGTRTSSSAEERACLGPALAMDALITVRLGQHEQGLELASEALRQLRGRGDMLSELRAANAHAEALMGLARFEEATAFLQDRIARAEARDELQAGHIGLYGNLAAVNFYTGAPARALQPLARALELAAALGEERRRALILGNFGNLYGQLEEHQKSLESHQLCAEILREHGSPRDLANALHNIGVQLDRLGDPRAALATFEESLALRDTGDDPSLIAKTELDRAYSLVHLERLDEAELAIERALALHRRAGSRRQEARALTSLANLEYERGRYREAIARFEQSRALEQDRPQNSGVTGNTLGIIEAHLALDDSRRALELLEACALPDSGDEGGGDAARLCDLWMRALERDGRTEHALEYAKRRIELLEELHASHAQRSIENLQGIHQVELMRQRERDSVRVRAELEALVAERTRQLMETNAELEARVDELVRAEFARSRLEEELRQAQKMDAIGRLAGGVAHDFNNLLTVILGRGELLLEEIRAEHPSHESLREMMEAASRAARLTVQLLAFGRKQALRPTRLDVQAILDDLERLLSRLLGERITVLVLRDRDPASEERALYVFADRGQLEQVFINLAINARDAMPRGGRLTFSASAVNLAPASYTHPNTLAPGNYVSIRVADTGEGMAPGVLEQIFEPFFTTKELGKGTGLGLSTVHGIVHQSGGTITAESAPGEGSTFEVLLPAASAPPVDQPREADAPSPVPEPRTVLVVEDDAGLRRVMREGLGRRGYEVLEAADGAAALACTRDIDLVICDLVLPKLSGLEVLAGLRTTRPDLPCLLISGHPGGEDDEASVAGVRFLSKPFKLEVLLRTLSEM